MSAIASLRERVAARPGYRWYVLGVLTAVYASSHVDRQIMGIRPDLVIEIRRDILEETDGPMLKYGLQKMDGGRLIVPRATAEKPRQAFLEERYELFREVG